MPITDDEYKTAIWVIQLGLSGLLWLNPDESQLKGISITFVVLFFASKWILDSIKEKEQRTSQEALTKEKEAHQKEREAHTKEKEDLQKMHAEERAAAAAATQVAQDAARADSLKQAETLQKLWEGKNEAVKKAAVLETELRLLKEKTEAEKKAAVREAEFKLLEGKTEAEKKAAVVDAKLKSLMGNRLIQQAEFYHMKQSEKSMESLGIDTKSPIKAPLAIASGSEGEITAVTTAWSASSGMERSGLTYDPPIQESD